MKEKKIKKKQFHKIPAVVLAVFVLVSVLALSAFADSVEANKFDHFGCSTSDVFYSNGMCGYECFEHGIFTAPLTKVYECEGNCYSYDDCKDDLSIDEFGVDGKLVSVFKCRHTVGVKDVVATNESLCGLCFLSGALMSHAGVINILEAAIFNGNVVALFPNFKAVATKSTFFVGFYKSIFVVCHIITSN